jgi:predicted Zn-dependent protease
MPIDHLSPGAAGRAQTGQTCKPRPRVARSLVLAAMVALALAGCSTINPGGEEPFRTGPAPGPSVPSEAPRVIGPRTATPVQNQRLIALFGGEYRAPKVESFLNGILVRLAAASDNPGQVYKVTLLNSPAVNAFALPSGDLFLTRGLLALANDSSEIAAVMAHEIAHVSLQHAHQREEIAKTEALRTKVAAHIQSPARGEEVKVTGRLNLASFSRQQELEADRIGVQVIARAGFDPYGASRFLRSLGRSVALRAALLGHRNSDEQPDILATHPSTPERVRQAVLAARKVGAPGIGDAGRAAYLAAIEGIDFGDDPAEGFVRRRRFIHGKLGFAFEAPSGFVLENSAQALIGVAGGGSQALRLDSVQVDAGKSLVDYLATGWIEGLQKDTIRAITINGLPAATASALHNGWHFRVAALRLGTDVYRLIFAARTMNDATDKAFAASIGSFRRIPTAEARKLRALRIALATARQGDSAVSFASTMAVSERALDVFLLINGLRRSDPLQTGEKYKTVVD